jgi:hypothetical protein
MCGKFVCGGKHVIFSIYLNIASIYMSVSSSLIGSFFLSKTDRKLL